VAVDEAMRNESAAGSGHHGGVAVEPPAPRHSEGDRFVATRSGMDFEINYHQLTNSDLASRSFLMADDFSSGVQYKSILANVLSDSTRGRRSSPGLWCPPARRSGPWSMLRFGAEQCLGGGGTRPHPSATVYSDRAATFAAAQPHSLLRQMYRENLSPAGGLGRKHRQISHTPEKILDAPDLVDDYYLNLLDWSSRNVLAVALGQTVYLWNAVTGQIDTLMQTSQAGDHVTSLRFGPDGSQIAVGTNTAHTKVYDVEKMALKRTVAAHTHRVGSLAWRDGATLTTGSRDSTIVNHDLRASPTALHSSISTLRGHRQEVCGLQWSPDGKQLASGGNDNVLNIWDLGRVSSGGGGRSSSAAEVATRPRFVSRQHCAAVKALAWCPHRRNLLASGGGTADRTIRFWNTSSGALRQTVDTKSQVCAIVWSRHEEELVSSHGFSHNQLILWKYPTMTKMAELTGHTSRVLHLAQSPDGETVRRQCCFADHHLLVCAMHPAAALDYGHRYALVWAQVVSGAADETLRFWKVFGPQSRASKRRARGQPDYSSRGASDAGTERRREGFGALTIR
jgi:cell division cycle protein 20 (cofactor of APC complex)